MRIIAVEEHFVTPAFRRGAGQGFSGPLQELRTARRLDRRTAVRDGRQARRRDGRRWHRHAGALAQLAGRRAGGGRRGRSPAPARRTISLPTRSRSIPRALPASPPCRSRRRTRPPKELERCVRQLGFKGTNHQRPHARPLSRRPFFSPILERADALDVPIYLHPTVPHKAGGRCALWRLLAGRQRRVRRRPAGAGTSRRRSTCCA